jgi:hypothetical protein
MNGEARMAVLRLKETKHILAAAMQPPAGGAPPAPETLAGAAFPLRLRMAQQDGPPALVLLPSSMLEAKLLPVDARVLAQPLFYAVNGGGVGELPTVPVPTGLTLSALSVTVQLAPGTTNGARKVLVDAREVTADYPEQRIQAGTLDSAQPTTLTLNLKIVPDGPEAGLEAGTACAVVVAIAGFRLVCFRGTVP